MTYRSKRKIKECIEKCYPGDKLCWRKEDGTWECETNQEQCVEYCRNKKTE